MLAVRWKDSTTTTVLPSMVQFKHRSLNIGVLTRVYVWHAFYAPLGCFPYGD